MKTEQLKEDLINAWEGYGKREYFGTGLRGWDMLTIDKTLLSDYSGLSKEKIDLILENKKSNLKEGYKLIIELIEAVGETDNLLYHLFDEQMVDFNVFDFMDEDEKFLKVVQQKLNEYAACGNKEFGEKLKKMIK